MSAEEELISCTRISDLSVRAYDSLESITIRTAYSTDIMPVRREHIPVSEMTNMWSYMKPMARHLMPISDIDIGLLIRYDCPRAIYPTELIPPVGNGTFAWKTVLGWGIIGVIDNTSLDHNPIGTSHQTIVSCASSIAFRTQVKERKSSTPSQSSSGLPGTLPKRTVVMPKCLSKTRSFSIL